MSQALQGINTIHTPRKHIVPTHLNVPDQVLTLWSLSLSARQLLLLLVGAGIGGTVWQHLAVLGHHARGSGVATPRDALAVPAGPGSCLLPARRSLPGGVAPRPAALPVAAQTLSLAQHPTLRAAPLFTDVGEGRSRQGRGSQAECSH